MELGPLCEVAVGVGRKKERAEAADGKQQRTSPPLNLTTKTNLLPYEPI